MRPYTFWRLLPVRLAAAAAAAFIAVSHTPSFADEEKKASPVSITADEITRSGETGKVTASGDVVIKYEGKTVEGDYAEYERESGDGAVEGAARFHDGKSDMSGDRIEFNSVTESGAAYNASGNFESLYYFNAKKVVRVDKDHYHIDRGNITTCELEEPHWRLDAKEADITLEDYARLKSLVFRAGGLPIFYLPYFLVSTKTKRATGFLTPSVGYSDKFGMRLENYFYWVIADNIDATFTHEYMGKAGNRVAAELRYVFGEGTDGMLNAELLKETDPDKPADRDLWKVRYDHHHALPWEIRNVIHVDMESEDSINREYSDDVASRTRRYTDSYATFNRNWSARSLYLTVREQKSTLPTREDSVQTLPNLSFVNQKERLWGSPFYAALESSFVNYATGTERNGVMDRYDVERFDLYPTLSLPVTAAPWLGLNASAGFRSTWYTEGLDEQGEVAEEGFSRELYTLSLTVTGPKMNRIFDTGGGTYPRVKHLITPTVTWGYLPGYEFDGADRKKVKVIDGVDASGAPYNLVTYQISNQLLVKEILGPESSRTFEALRFNISQSYNINEANRTENPQIEKRPLTPILFNLDTRLFSWLMVNYDTTFNVYDSVWEAANLEVGFRYEDAFHFALDRGYRRGAANKPDVVWDTAYVEVNLPWKVSLDYSIIYDEVNRITNDSLLRVRYREDCWGFAVNWYQRKINTKDSSGAPVLDDETKVMFTITLEGVGDITGGEQAPLANRKI